MEESFIFNLEPVERDVLAHGRYESTLALIDLVISTYSEMIYKAESVDPADPAVEGWRRARRQASADRDALRSHEPEMIERNHRHYAEILQRLRDEDATRP